jgi:hypothetical protein
VDFLNNPFTIRLCRDPQGLAKSIGFTEGRTTMVSIDLVELLCNLFIFLTLIAFRRRLAEWNAPIPMG